MKIIKMKFKGLFYLVLVTFLISACGKTVKKPEPVKAPEQIISVETAREMYDTYSERRVPIIIEYEREQNSKTERSDADGAFNPTRSGLYDFQTIKQYIAYIEQEAEEAGVEISGLQFYFANYPDKEKFDDGTPVTYPRKNSFFLVPTLKLEGKDYAFYTAETEDGQRKAVLISDSDKVVSGKTQEFEPPNHSKSNVVDENGLTGSIFRYANFISSSGFSTANAFSRERSLVLNESNLVPPPNQTDFD